MTDYTLGKRLADYLPYEFRKLGEQGEETDTLKFLKAFERMLLGQSVENDLADTSLKEIKGLEQTLAGMADYFHPEKGRSPDDFLPWLSQWVALSLRADMSAELQREFIAKIVPLYQMRGTKTNMEQLLTLFVGKDNSGKDRYVEVNEVPTQPHYFTVLLDLNNVKDSSAKAEYERAEQKAHAVIRMAKPAHTRYLLMPKIDAFCIGPYNSCPEIDYVQHPDALKNCQIIVGKNTRLGMAD